MRLLRRRGQKAGFLGARPAPKRVAGYVPGLPLETRRAKEPELEEIPVPPTAVPEKIYPPVEPAFFPPVGGYRTPPVLVIPPIPHGVPPPTCTDNPDTPENECNPENPPPPPPPEEVPEPDTFLILAVSAASLLLLKLRRPRKVPVRA